MKAKTFKIKKSGRVCYDFPWQASKVTPQPWKGGYHRVVIPLTAAERKTANHDTKCHIQIVKATNLEEVREARLALR